MAKRGPRNIRRVHPGMDVSATRDLVTTGGAKASKSGLVDFAEDLGRILGTAQAKASNWLNQRKQVINELTRVRDTANRLLANLAAGGPSLAAGRQGARRRRPVGLKNSGPSTGARKGRRYMSAAARKAVSQRMRKYWAQRRRQKAAS
jgi:hypothetical protein